MNLKYDNVHLKQKLEVHMQIVKISTQNLYNKYIDEIKAMYRFGFCYEENGIFEFEFKNGFELPLNQFTFYLAILNGKIIGFASTTHLKRKSYLLANLYILPQFRGNNFGKKLILQVLQNLKKDGANKVIVHALLACSTTFSGFCPAIFYENLGFSHEGFLQEHNKYSRTLSVMNINL